jgi:hypothetical protein
MLAISLICLNNVCACVSHPPTTHTPFDRHLPEIIYCGTPWENVLQQLCLEIFECQNASAYSVIRWCRFYFLYRAVRGVDYAPPHCFSCFICSCQTCAGKFWSSLFQLSRRKTTNLQILLSQVVKPHGRIQSWHGHFMSKLISISSCCGLSVDCWVTCWIAGVEIPSNL